MKGMKNIALQAGSLEVEILGGNVGAIRYQGVEVLRGISFLVRDENWGTCPAVIKDFKIRRAKNSFEISYAAVAENNGVSLLYHAKISASRQQLTFHAQAKPEQNFRTNRTGFVVLHPIKGVAGKPLTVTHTDGTKQRSRFPDLISPGQPFFEIRALEHAPAPGLKAHVLMEGNKFEMEDQRNWTDASYKTYVCSLLEPWPYVLPAGESFDQRITVTLRGKPRKPARKSAPARQQKLKLPEIGIAIPSAEALESLNHIAALRQLAPSHLTFTLDGAQDMASACSAYARLSREAGIPVVLEIVLPAKAPAEAEMQIIAKAASEVRLTPARVVVTQRHDLKSFQPTDERPWGPSYEEMAAAARRHFPTAEIGGGMLSYFTELNRKRPPQGLFDFITHSICPIVHDASDAAVMQTLESLPHIFATAKSFIGDTAYHLGPSSLGARMNPYGQALADNPQNKRVCLAPNDPRQLTRFAVEWNRGVIIAAARAGLSSITLSSLTGAQGLLNANGRKSPLFRFLARLIPLAGKDIPVQLVAGDP